MAQEIADSKLIDTWSSDGLKVKPDISKIIEGWQLGEQPPHEYMNWLQNTFGSKLNHILKNGVAGWNNTTQYLAGATVQHTGNVWLCKTTNTNSAPTDANSNWKRIITVESLTTVLSGYVATTGNQTIAGVKTFSSTISGSITGSCENFGIGTSTILTETNLNNYLSGGKFTTPSTGLSNLPSGWSQARYVIDVSGGSNYASQLLTNPINGNIAVRGYNGTTWTSWKEVVFTSDFTGANQSLGGSGYQKLPGGVIIQWGSVTTNNGVGVWTYPIAFPTICAQVFVSQDTVDASISVGASRKVGFEKTKADLKSLLTTGGDAFYAWAIGY